MIVTMVVIMTGVVVIAGVTWAISAPYLFLLVPLSKLGKHSVVGYDCKTCYTIGVHDGFIEHEERFVFPQLITRTLVMVVVKVLMVVTVVMIVTQISTLMPMLILISMVF